MTIGYVWRSIQAYKHKDKNCANRDQSTDIWGNQKQTPARKQNNSCEQDHLSRGAKEAFQSDLNLFEGAL